MTFTFPKSALPEELTPAEKARREQQAIDAYSELRKVYIQARQSQHAEVEAIRLRWEAEKAQPTAPRAATPDEDYESPPLPAPGPMMRILKKLSGREDTDAGRVVTATPKASDAFTPERAFHPLGKYSGQVGPWFERRGMFSLLGKFSNQRGRWFE